MTIQPRYGPPYVCPGHWTTRQVPSMKWYGQGTICTIEKN